MTPDVPTTAADSNGLNAAATARVGGEVSTSTMGRSGRSVTVFKSMSLGPTAGVAHLAMFSRHLQAFHDFEKDSLRIQALGVKEPENWAKLQPSDRKAFISAVIGIPRAGAKLTADELLPRRLKLSHSVGTDGFSPRLLPRSSRRMGTAR